MLFRSVSGREMGPSRRKALMKYFKSIEELRAADTAKISEVPGITANVAEEIYRFFNKEVPENTASE